MIKDGLYHRDVWLPGLKLGSKPIKVNYTLHAQEAALTDRLGKIELNDYIIPVDFDIIEVEIKNSNLYKMVLRKSYNDTCDITIVIQVDSLNVKTVWLNEKSDSHKTLNKSRYIQAPK